MKRALPSRLAGVFALLGGLLPVAACMAANPRAAPPQPAPASEDIQIVLLARSGPILLRVQVQTEGPKPTTRWAEHLRDWFAFLDRDGDGKLNPEEFRRAPPPDQVRRQWQSGLYPPLGEPGADLRTADADKDHLAPPPSLRLITRPAVSVPTTSCSRRTTTRRGLPWPTHSSACSIATGTA
jgi:hypothetical protein